MICTGLDVRVDQRAQIQLTGHKKKRHRSEASNA